MDELERIGVLPAFDEAGVFDPPPPPPQALNTIVTARQIAPRTYLVEVFIGTPSLLSFLIMRLLSDVTGYGGQYTVDKYFQIVRFDLSDRESSLNFAEAKQLSGSCIRGATHRVMVR